MDDLADGSPAYSLEALMVEVMHWHQLASQPLPHWRLAYSDKHNAHATWHYFQGQWDWCCHGKSGLATSEAEAIELATNAFLEHEIAGG